MFRPVPHTVVVALLICFRPGFEALTRSGRRGELDVKVWKSAPCALFRCCRGVKGKPRLADSCQLPAEVNVVPTLPGSIDLTIPWLKQGRERGGASITQKVRNGIYTEL